MKKHNKKKQLICFFSNVQTIGINWSAFLKKASLALHAINPHRKKSFPTETLSYQLIPMVWKSAKKNSRRNSFPEGRKYAMISLASVAGFRTQVPLFQQRHLRWGALRRMVSSIFPSRPQSLAIDKQNTFVRLRCPFKFKVFWLSKFFTVITLSKTKLVL